MRACMDTVCMHVHVHVRVCVHLCVHGCVCVHACVCVRTCGLIIPSLPPSPQPCSQDSTLSRDKDTSSTNGSLANGGSSPGSPQPTIKITTTRQNGNVSNGSGCGEDMCQRELSSPPPRPRTATPETPSHRSREALKKVLQKL